MDTIEETRVFDLEQYLYDHPGALPAELRECVFRFRRRIQELEIEREEAFDRALEAEREAEDCIDSEYLEGELRETERLLEAADVELTRLRGNADVVARQLARYDEALRKIATGKISMWGARRAARDALEAL